MFRCLNVDLHLIAWFPPTMPLNVDLHLIAWSPPTMPLNVDFPYALSKTSFWGIVDDDYLVVHQQTFFAHLHFAEKTYFKPMSTTTIYYNIFWPSTISKVDVDLEISSHLPPPTLVLYVKKSTSCNLVCVLLSRFVSYAQRVKGATCSSWKSRYGL